MLVFYNIFYIKQILQSYIYVVLILSALTNEDNLGLSYYSKSQNYQKS